MLNTTFDSISKPLPWSFAFAKGNHLDLEFEDSFDDDDGMGSNQKPPYQRPLIILLILALIIIGIYALSPQFFSSTTDTVNAPAETTPDSPMGVFNRSLTPPTPRFSEGQQVSLLPLPDHPSGTATLSRDALGILPGPSIHIGELLTIIDGEWVDGKWVYQVHTTSGGSGWIPGRKLQTAS